MDTTPKVGDIACRTTGRAGHVAYVNAVYADGSFDVEEYNHNWANGYGHIYGKRHLTKANTCLAAVARMIFSGSFTLAMCDEKAR